MNDHFSSHDSDDSFDSSGAVTPADHSAGASAYLPAAVSSLWGGIVRRFSYETSSYFSSASPSLKSSYHVPYLAQNNGIDGLFYPSHIHETSSPMRPPPLDPLALRGFRDDTPTKARVLTSAIAEEIRIMIPTRLSIVDHWNLVYSLEQDGASLATLYEKCARYEGKRVGFVLTVKDHEGGIFGAYLSDFPHLAPSYFGTGECFLWRASVMASLPPPPSTDTTHLVGRTTTIANPPDLLTPSSPTDYQYNNDRTHCQSGPPTPSIRFKAFPYSGINEYYILCDAHYFSIGAGDGRYGLWLNDCLSKGVSSTCLTFGNERLSDEGEKFGVLGVEIWVIGGAD